jgi:hypothetical protein
VKNRLVVIGYSGSKRAYLNVSRSEAIRRYLASEEFPPSDDMIQEFEFVDEFWVHSASE